MPKTLPEHGATGDKQPKKRHKTPARCLRINPNIWGLIERMSEETGKTCTRIVEDSVLLHGKTAGHYVRPTGEIEFTKRARLYRPCR